jgi:hypothetical protein
MIPNFVKALVATLALTGAAASSAQGNSTASDASQTSPSIAEAMKLASADSVPLSRGELGSAIAVTSVSSQSQYAFENASPQGHLGSKGTGLELNEWVLIGMGVFLIGAISHRRATAIAD